jgi:hypothetical protein
LFRYNEEKNEEKTKIYTYVEYFHKKILYGVKWSNNIDLRKIGKMTLSSDRTFVIFGTIVLFGLPLFLKVESIDQKPLISAKSFVEKMKYFYDKDFEIIDITEQYKDIESFKKAVKKKKDNNFYMFIKLCDISNFPQILDNSAVNYYTYEVNVLATMTQIFYNKKEILDYRENFIPERILKTGEHTSIFEQPDALREKYLQNLKNQLNIIFSDLE